MGLEGINWTGMESWDKLLNLSPFPDNLKVIVIGCGRGKCVFYLAEKHGLKVIGNA